MALLSPWFLLGACAAAIPVVLHLRRQQPDQRVPFSAVAFLRQAPVEQSSRRQLSHWLLLALRVLALLLLALAFARPVLDAQTPTETEVSVVALDTSMSLSAPGRFEMAQRRALAAIDEAPTGRRVAVVTFGGTAVLASPPAMDRGAARAAVARARVLAEPTDYAQAVRMAAALASHGGDVVVVTDLQASGWQGADVVPVDGRVQVRVDDLGEPPPNLAVVALRATSDSLIATIRNTAPVTVDAAVAATVHPQEGPATSLAGPRVSVPACASVDVPWPRPTGAWAAVEVSDPTGARGDNVRAVALSAITRGPVVVVTGTGDPRREALYVTHALEAASDSGGRAATRNLPARVLGETDGLRDAGAVVVLGTDGLDHRGRQRLATYLRDGGSVLVAAGPGVDGAILSQWLADAGVTATVQTSTPPLATPQGWVVADGRHPLARALDAGGAPLGLVSFAHIATVTAPGCRTVARFTGGGIALADCAAGRGKLLLLASDLDRQWNDFPLRVAFAPFVLRAVRGEASEQLDAEAIVGRLPAALAAAPVGTAVAWPLDAAQGERRWLPVNADPAESDPARLTPAQFAAHLRPADTTATAAARVRRTDAEAAQQLWWWALAAMLAVVVGESVVARVA